MLVRYRAIMLTRALNRRQGVESAADGFWMILDTVSL